jgi:hypothetical protein
MSFTLKLIFIGSIAFAPNASQDSMEAILVNAVDESFASDGSMIHRHFPIIIYNCKNRVGGCTAEDAAVAARSSLKATWGFPDISALGVRQITFSDVSLKGAFPERTLSIELDKLAKMTSISSKAAKLDPDVGLNNEQKLAIGRVILNNGTAVVNKLAMGGTQRYRFKPLRAATPATVTPQVLVDRVAVNVVVSGSEVELDLVPFGGGTPVPIRLRSITPNPNEEVVVYISNKMECTTFKQPTPPLAGPVNIPVLVERSPLCDDSFAKPPADKGQHFELFYELSMTRPPLRLRPVPALVDGPINGDDRPICPQVMMVR